MNKEDEKKKEEQLTEEALTAERHRHFRESDDMPGQLRGRGPQENSAIGYDALEDL